MIRKPLSALLALLLVFNLWAGAPKAHPALAEAPAAVDAASDEENPDDGWLYADDEDEGDFSEADEEDGSEFLAEVAADGEDVTDSLEDPEEDDLLGAMDVFSWFAMQPLDVDESLPDPSGTMWRVLDERFNTRDGMLSMLHYYFSDAIVEELWNSPTNPYKEIDGHLYTAGDGRDMDDSIGETEFTVTTRTDSRVEIDVGVHYINPDEDGVSDDSFHYVRELIGGEWKYTEFPFFW